MCEVSKCLGLEISTQFVQYGFASTMGSRPGISLSHRKVTLPEHQPTLRSPQESQQSFDEKVALHSRFLDAFSHEPAQSTKNHLEAVLSVFAQ
jgi:hypothetical protein